MRRVMFKRFIRQQLHALVWVMPMARLATEFGLSDVALQAEVRKSAVGEN
jgi:hypothetical protein